MDSREKKQLKRQLEGQASFLVSETSDVALVAGLLTTCSALLRTAEQNMPAAFTNQEFDQIYAGYLGLAGGVNRFSQFGQGYLSQTYKTLLQEQMDKATQLQQERKTLEDQLTQTQHQQAETQQAVTQLKGQLDSAQAEHRAAETQKAQLTQEVNDFQSKTEALKAQRDSLQRQKERFEPDLEALLQAVTAAKESYQELVAYYAELERIQKGMEAEGFVDMASFAQAMEERNQQSATLMADYDRILDNVLADVEALQRKVDERRRAGN